MGGVAYLEPYLSCCHVIAHLSGVLETEPVAISESPGQLSFKKFFFLESSALPQWNIVTVNFHYMHTIHIVSLRHMSIKFNLPQITYTSFIAKVLITHNAIYRQISIQPLFCIYHYYLLEYGIPQVDYFDFVPQKGIVSRKLLGLSGRPEKKVSNGLPINPPVMFSVLICVFPVLHVVSLL